MPAILSAQPTLSAATVLGSYALPSGKAGETLLQTQAASSSRLSYAAVGEVVRISSGTIRRAKGTIAKVAAGHAVVLYEVSFSRPARHGIMAHVD